MSAPSSENWSKINKKLTNLTVGKLIFTIANHIKFGMSLLAWLAIKAGLKLGTKNEVS